MEQHKSDLNDDNILVPRNVMTGLFRIMCGVPSTMGGIEVYQDAIPNMKVAHEWVLKYGKQNGIDPHGFDEVKR